MGEIGLVTLAHNIKPHQERARRNQIWASTCNQSRAPHVELISGRSLARRCERSNRGNKSWTTGKIFTWKFGRVSPSREKLGIVFRSKVGAVWIKPPPLAFDNDPWLTTRMNELTCCLFLGNSGDGLRAFGQSDSQALQSVLNVGIAQGVDDAITRIQAVDAGIVDLD